MEVFTAVYQNLTGKKVVFDYLIYQRNSELVMQRECLIIRLSRGGPCSTPAHSSLSFSFSRNPCAPRARLLCACAATIPCLLIRPTYRLQARARGAMLITFAPVLATGTPNRYPCDPAGFLSYSEVKPAPLFEADPGTMPEEEAQQARMVDAAL